MSGTDIVLHDLAVTGPLGEPTGLIFPDGSGEVASLDDPAGLARWYRSVLDLEQESIRPAKQVAAAALYHAMDSQGEWTLHLGDLEVSGESAATWEQATKVDAEALYEDLVTLRQREGSTAEDAEDWANDFMKVEMTLTAAGKRRLEKMPLAYREALAEHTELLERSRKAPSVRRAK